MGILSFLCIIVLLGIKERRLKNAQLIEENVKESAFLLER